MQFVRCGAIDAVTATVLDRHQTGTTFHRVGCIKFHFFVSVPPVARYKYPRTFHFRNRVMDDVISLQIQRWKMSGQQGCKYALKPIIRRQLAEAHTCTIEDRSIPSNTRREAKL